MMGFQFSGMSNTLSNRFQTSQATARDIRVNTFDGDGNDFLSPGTIIKSVDEFSGNIGPITSSGRFTLFSDPFDTMADAEEVLGDTNRELDAIFSNGFLANANRRILSRAVTPSQAFITDLKSFNPLIWKNPSSTNVFFGTMDAQNVIYGGHGILPRPFADSPFPLFPFIKPPGVPFNDLASENAYNRFTGGSGSSLPSGSPSVYGDNPLDTLQEAQFFPRTFLSGQPFYYVVDNPAPSPGNGGGGADSPALVRQLIQDKIDLLQTHIDDVTRQLTRVLKTDSSDSFPFREKRAEAVRLQARIAVLKQQQDQVKKELEDFENSPQVPPPPPYISAQGQSIVDYLNIIRLMQSLQ